MFGRRGILQATMHGMLEGRPAARRTATREGKPRRCACVAAAVESHLLKQIGHLLRALLGHTQRPAAAVHGVLPGADLPQQHAKGIYVDRGGAVAVHQELGGHLQRMQRSAVQVTVPRKGRASARWQAGEQAARPSRQSAAPAGAALTYARVPRPPPSRECCCCEFWSALVKPTSMRAAEAGLVSTARRALHTQNLPNPAGQPAQPASLPARRTPTLAVGSTAAPSSPASLPSRLRVSKTFRDLMSKCVRCLLCR